MMTCSYIHFEPDALENIQKLKTLRLVKFKEIYNSLPLYKERGLLTEIGKRPSGITYFYKLDGIAIIFHFIAKKIVEVIEVKDEESSFATSLTSHCVNQVRVTLC